MNFKLHPSLYWCPENKVVISLDSIVRVTDLWPYEESSGNVHFYCCIWFIGSRYHQEFHFTTNNKEESEKGYRNFIQAWSDWKEKVEKL